MTGRLDTEAPDTNVRIALKRGAKDPLGSERTSVRPARPGVAPISSIEEVDEADDQRGLPPRSNREDLEPPALEAEEALRDAQDRSPVGLSARDETAVRGSGWTRGHQSGNGSATGTGPSTRRRSEEGSLPPMQIQDDRMEDSEEVNPLPPAPDPDPVGSRVDR